jgi:hypothetical protein
MSPPSRPKSKSSKKRTISKHRMIVDGLLFGLLFDPQDVGSTVLRNAGEIIPTIGRCIPEYNIHQHILLFIIVIA